MLVTIHVDNDGRRPTNGDGGLSGHDVEAVGGLNANAGAAIDDDNNNLPGIPAEAKRR